MHYERRFRWTRVWIDASLDAIHRPHVGINRVPLPDGDFDHRRAEISLSWGDGGCDPVWLVDFTVRCPRRVVERIPW